jgi:hypothetical protein
MQGGDLDLKRSHAELSTEVYHPEALLNVVLAIVLAKTSSE